MLINLMFVYKELIAMSSLRTTNKTQLFENHGMADDRKGVLMNTSVSAQISAVKNPHNSILMSIFSPVPLHCAKCLQYPSHNNKYLIAPKEYILFKTFVGANSMYSILFEGFTSCLGGLKHIYEHRVVSWRRRISSWSG